MTISNLFLPICFICSPWRCHFIFFFFFCVIISMCNIVTSDDCHRFEIDWCAYVTLSTKMISWRARVSFMSQFALYFPSFPLQFNQNELTQVEWGKKIVSQIPDGFLLNLQHSISIPTPTPIFKCILTFILFWLISSNVVFFFVNFFFQFISLLCYWLSAGVHDSFKLKCRSLSLFLPSLRIKKIHFL